MHAYFTVTTAPSMLRVNLHELRNNVIIKGVWLTQRRCDLEKMGVVLFSVSLKPPFLNPRSATVNNFDYWSSRLLYLV